MSLTLLAITTQSDYGLDFEEIIFRRSGTVYVQTTTWGSPT